MTAAARSAAVATGKVSGGTCGLTRRIAPGRFEMHIEVVRRPKPRTKLCRIQLRRTEVVEDQRVVVQQRLDVNQLPIPVELREYALTKLEVPALSLHLRASPRNLIVGRQPQNDRSRILWQIMETVAAGGRILLGDSVLSCGIVGPHHGEDFPNLDPPLGFDHDELAPLKRRTVAEGTGEPSHVRHHAVADKVSAIEQPVPPRAVVATARS